MAAAAASECFAGGVAASDARGAHATRWRRPPLQVRGSGSGGGRRPRRMRGVGVAATARGAAAEGVAAASRLATGAERVAAAAASDLRVGGAAAAAARRGCTTWKRRPPPVMRGSGSGGSRHRLWMRGVGVAATARGVEAEGVAAAASDGAGGQ